MAYTVFAGLLVVLSLLVLLIASRLLFKGSWFLGWLRGTSGFVLLVATIVLVLTAFDFFSYKQLAKEESIASISFTELAPQRFQVSLVDVSGNEKIYELNGDLWQLDARIIKWDTSLAALGMQPGYRLARLSGRYYSLEEEHSQKRTVYEVGESKSILDVWGWLNTNSLMKSVVDASYGSATYLPMKDGALFSVNLSNTGLLARPLNERATKAIDSWQ